MYFAFCGVGSQASFTSTVLIVFVLLKVMHKRCLDLTNLLSEILLMKMQVLAVASRKSVKAFVLEGNLVQC